MSYGDGGFYFLGPVNGDYGDGGFYFTGPVNGDYSGAFMPSGSSASFHASRGIGRRKKSSYGASDAINWTGSGDYRYSIDSNGTITILNSGAKVTPASDGKSYNAIVDEADRMYPSLSAAILARADKAWAAYRSKPTSAPSTSTSSVSSVADKALKSANQKGGVLTYVAIGAGIVVLVVGAGIWYTDSQAAAEARAAGRVRLY